MWNRLVRMLRPGTYAGDNATPSPTVHTAPQGQLTPSVVQLRKTSNSSMEEAITHVATGVLASPWRSRRLPHSSDHLPTRPQPREPLPAPPSSCLVKPLRRSGEMTRLLTSLSSESLGTSRNRLQRGIKTESAVQGDFPTSRNCRDYHFRTCPSQFGRLSPTDTVQRFLLTLACVGADKHLQDTSTQYRNV